MSILLPVFAELGDTREVFHNLDLGVHRKSEIVQVLQARCVREQWRTANYFTELVGPEVETAAGGNGWIFLAQAASTGVARIDGHWFRLAPR